VWAATALAGGGMDLGTGSAGAGALGALVAAGLAPLAAAALWYAGGRALAGAPARLALAAATGLAVWSGLSILWAVEPSLAWLATGRQAVALAALVLGLAAAAALPRAAERFPVALSVAAAPAVAVALATVALPGLLVEDGARARLEAPVGYPNALALLAAVALPGALLAGARPGAGPALLRVAAAGTTALVATVVLTLSRGGVAAAAVAALLTLALIPGGRRGLATLLAGLAGAVPGLMWALTAPGLSEDGLDASARTGDGAVFGLLLVGGMAGAALLAGPAAARLTAGPGRALRRAALAGALLAALAPAAVLATDAGDLLDCGRSAVGNASDRLVQLDANQRGAWWCEAGRAWRDAPVAGHGAGSFPVTQRRFRRDAQDVLLTRDPHQMWLAPLAALGLVGLALTALLWGALAWAVVRIGAGAAAGPVAVVAAALVQAQTDWVIQWPALAVPVAAAAGILLHAAARPPASPAPSAAPRRRSPALAAALAAAGLAVPLTAALPLLSQHAVQRGRDALAAGDLRGALDDAGRARSLNPLALDPLFLRARVFAAAGDPRRQREALRRATEVQPDNPASWRRLALALDEAPGARRAWIQVHLLDPYAADARAALGIPPPGSVPPDVARRG